MKEAFDSSARGQLPFSFLPGVMQDPRRLPRDSSPQPAPELLLRTTAKGFLPPSFYLWRLGECGGTLLAWSADGPARPALPGAARCWLTGAKRGNGGEMIGYREEGKDETCGGFTGGKALQRGCLPSTKGEANAVGGRARGAAVLRVGARSGGPQLCPGSTPQKRGRKERKIESRSLRFTFNSDMAQM